jgi:hypothetical protein
MAAPIEEVRYHLAESLVVRLINALDAAAENAYELEAEHRAAYGDRLARRLGGYQGDRAEAAHLAHSLKLLTGRIDRLSNPVAH